MRSFQKLVIHSAMAGLLAGSASAVAQPATPVTPLEPAAMAAIDRMSAALRSLPGFTMDADVTNEVTLDSGQKLQFSGKVRVLVRRPDSFKLVAAGDTQHREYYFNGRSFTVFAPRLGYYTSVPAPETIGLALDRAKTKYGIELPLADLFTWGTDQTIRSRVRSGYLIRPETIEGRTCDHYAFRQDMVDWQIWIEQGEQGLPCKLVITDTGDPSMPQYTAVMHWTSLVPPSVDQLAFAPPASAHKIAIQDLTGSTAKGN